MDFYPFNKHVFEPFEKNFTIHSEIIADNKEAIRNCQSMQIVIDKLRNKINRIIEDGQFAQHQLTNQPRKIGKSKRRCYDRQSYPTEKGMPEEEPTISKQLFPEVYEQPQEITPARNYSSGTKPSKRKGRRRSC